MAQADLPNIRGGSLLALTLKFKAPFPSLDTISAETCCSQLLQAWRVSAVCRAANRFTGYCFFSILLEWVPGSSTVNQGTGFAGTHHHCAHPRTTNSCKPDLWQRRTNAVICAILYTSPLDLTTSWGRNRRFRLSICTAACLQP